MKCTNDTEDISLGMYCMVISFYKEEREKRFIHMVEYSGVTQEICTVPDRRRRIVPEVLVVRHWVIGVLGIGGGRVKGKGWDRGGQFTSNLRPRWTDPVTARRVPSK
jgi:hypothetical protein